MQNLGRQLYAQGDLGNCERKREKLWFGNDRTAQLAPDLRTAMPSGGRRAGTNSVPAGPCLSPDDRAIPRVQAAAMLLMITSVGRWMRRRDRRRGNVTRWSTCP
jgi:hypothetical protein